MRPDSPDPQLARRKEVRDALLGGRGAGVSRSNPMSHEIPAPRPPTHQLQHVEENHRAQSPDLPWASLGRGDGRPAGDMGSEPAGLPSPRPGNPLTRTGSAV